MHRVLSRARRSAVALALTGGCLIALAACGSAAPPARHPHRLPRPPVHRVRDGPHQHARRPAAPRRPRAAARTHPGAYAVGLRVLHLVDHRRTIALPDGSRRPRPLTTFVRYPALGAPGPRDRPQAPAARADGPFPLVVFGHGFAVTPGIYDGLLHEWAAAGFVVAAPVFPLENADAPGGPDERDLPNQPEDMRVVIDRLLAARGWATGLIDPRRIAVAGHSDGGETALVLAYDRFYRDPRVRAAVLLSGAQLPGGGRSSLLPGGPPLLAVQGTADTINPPARTLAFFDAVRVPRFLLSLTGASHLAPYTSEQPQLSIVERASTAFLRAYLGPRAGRARWLRALAASARRPGLAELLARP